MNFLPDHADCFNLTLLDLLASSAPSARHGLPCGSSPTSTTNCSQGGLSAAGKRLADLLARVWLNFFLPSVCYLLTAMWSSGGVWASVQATKAFLKSASLQPCEVLVVYEPQSRLQNSIVKSACLLTGMWSSGSMWASVQATNTRKYACIHMWKAMWSSTSKWASVQATNRRTLACIHMWKPMWSSTSKCARVQVGMYLVLCKKRK